MSSRWHGIVGSVGIIGVVAAPGLIVDRLLTSIDLTPVHPVFTNDLSFGPNGDIYITDTGIQLKPDGTSEHPGPDRIYRVTRDGQVTVALESAALDEPDGIAWSSQRRDFLLAPLGGQTIQTWKPSGTPASESRF